jgi:ribonuclease E
MPSGEGAHISRKIEDEEERRRIKALAASLDPPENVGLIVRTAGMEQPKQVLARDLKYLLGLWNDIEARFRSAGGAALLHQDHDAILRTLRDYLTTDVNRIIVDTPQAYQTARTFISIAMPKQESMVELYDGRRSIFTEYDVEKEVESLYQRRAPLPGGGYLVIDQTEALVSIDVNSGKHTKEGSQEETAYRTNLEAVTEVARQLKLRDLGGIVVVDLIDMLNANHRAEVEKRFREAIKSDKARFKVSPISQHGLLELTRQRIRPALLEGTMVTCPECDGRGRVRAPQSQGTHVLRAIADKLSAELAQGQSARLTVDAELDLAMHLLNERRDSIASLEEQHGVVIRIQVKSHLPAPHYAMSVDKDFVVEQRAIKRVAVVPQAQPVPSEDIERELPIAAEQEPVAAQPAVEPALAAGGNKKRRRRRGRGGKGNGNLAPVSSASDSNDEDAFEVAVLPMTAEPTPIAMELSESESEESQETSEKKPGMKPKRRRRRGGRGKRKVQSATTSPA